MISESAKVHKNFDNSYLAAFYVRFYHLHISPLMVFAMLKIVMGTTMFGHKKSFHFRFPKKSFKLNHSFGGGGL